MAKIALVYPAGFYAYVAEGLADGFRAHGHECTLLEDAVTHGALVRWVKDNDAALCFSINRTLPPESEWPSSVPYFSWVIDYRQHGKDILGDFGASHRLYFIMHPRAYGLAEVRHSWSMLVPGCRPQETIIPPTSPKTDFSLFGFIPEPLIYESPVGKMPDGSLVTLGDFLKRFPMERLHMAKIDISAIRRAADQTMAAIGCEPFDLENLKQVCDDILIRTVDRTAMLDAILTISRSLDIYGPPNWLKWERFAPYYRGMIENPAGLLPMARQAKIHLHNGCLAMHFRVVDALAAGAFTMVNRTSFDGLVGGIATLLDEGRDYVAFDIEETAETAGRFLRDDTARSAISGNGQRAVFAHHTWAHRAAQILKDADVRN